MTKKVAVSLSFLLSLSVSQAFGQSVNRGKLALAIADLYGPSGLALDSDKHRAHFDSSFRSNFAPFNNALAGQLTSLPIPSTAAGFTYAFDPTLGTYVRSAQSFGPILTERAETVGTDRFYFGFSFQHFSFDNLDDLSLDNIPAVFRHQPTVDPDSPFLKDMITSRNLIDLQMGQMTTFFTYGLNDRVDISVAIPFVTTNLDVISDVQIQRIGTADDPDIPHTFQAGRDVAQRTFQNGGSASGLGDVIIRAKGTATKWENAGLALGADLQTFLAARQCGLPVQRRQRGAERIGTADDPDIPHTFQAGRDVAQRTFQNGGSASGLGDVIIRAKGTATKWENAGLALGADLRLPTGNELDFLGSGAPGFKPFAVFSYNYKRFSPHVNVGYQFNGDSVLAGDIQAGIKAGLPDQFLYSAGIDIGVTRKFSLAADFLGQRLIDTQRVLLSSVTAVDGTIFPTVAFQPGGINLAADAFGFKLNPASTVLVTFNVIVQLNDGGLRDKVVPLIGISFTP